MMPEDKLNPSSETLLVEKLKFDEDTFDFLQFIRRQMRYIVEKEKREKEIHMQGIEGLGRKQTPDS